MDAQQAERVLVGLQVTAHSSLGAVALQTGGLLVDDGWLRILGSGCARMQRDLVGWNNLGGEHRLPGALLVADDAVGGFFAINGGAFAGESGNVFYRAPECGDWEDMERGYSGFLAWAFTGDLQVYYDEARWDEWREDSKVFAPDRATHIWPPLGTKGPPTSARSRREIPVEQMWTFIDDFWRQVR